MPSIDNRIVQMEFDNKQFEKGIKQSSNSLKTLEKSLMIKDSSLSHLAVAVDDIAKRFTTLGIVGVTALQNITNSAINAGKRLISSLSFDQINAGFNKYEQTVASVQTIMNSTGKSIDDVNGYLAKLMWFSDETSYSFTDMTSALATMVSSGGDIDKLIPMITGVANATAFAGKGAAEFSRIMQFGINQAYSLGSMQIRDWKSIEVATVNSKQLMETLIAAGEALGKIEKGDVTLESFRYSLAKKWLDRTVMETAFGVFSELSEAAYELVQSGKFKTAKEAMDSLAGQYSEIAEKAFISAQSAKTLTEAINATKDAVSSGWMRTYELVMGNLTEATALWSGVTSKLWDTFASGAEARNELLQGWRDLEGREALIGVFVNIYNTLVLIAAAIKIAWQAVFPPTTAEGLANATKGLEAFTKGIVDWLTGMNGGSRRIEQISKIFEGFFGVLKIGWTIVKAVFNTIADVIGAILPGSAVDGFLSFFSDIGGSISDFANNLEKNEAFIGFFKSIGDFFKGIVSSDIFKKAVAIFNDFIAAIPAIATGIWEFAKSIYTYLTTSEDIKKWIGTISTFFAPFIAKIKSWGKKLKEALRSLFGGKAADKGKSFWDLLKEQFATPEGIKTFFNNALALIKKTWTDFRQKVIDIFTGKDNKKLLAGGGGGARPEEKITFFDVLGNFFKDFGKWFSGNWGWVALVAGAAGVIYVIKSIRDILRTFSILRGDYRYVGLTGFVSNIMKVAGSIIAVIGALTLLTLLDQTKLNRALEIVGAITTILFAISALGAIPGLSGGYKLGLGMMGIAASVVLVIVAIKQVMKLMEGIKTAEDVGRLVGAVIAVGVLVGALMLLTRLLNNVTFSGDWKVIVGIAAGVWIIVKALRPLADMSWGQLAKMGAALLSFGVIMAGLLYIAESTPGGGTLKIGGMVGLALGIWLVIEALKPLTDMEWEDLGKMGAVLGGIVLAMGLYLKASKGMNAAGTVAAIGSLVVMAGVISVLGTALREVRDVSWEQTTAFTAGMTTMLLGMALAFKLLGTMSIKAVGIALLAILGVIVIVGLVVWAFGELSRDPDFQTFITGAGASLGAMIGAFVGALDAAKMVAFAEGLNAFKNITVDEAAMDNAILVAGMLNEFSEALPEKPFIKRLGYLLAPSEVELLSDDISAFGRAVFILSKGIDSVKAPAEYVGTTTIVIDAVRAVAAFLNSLFSEGLTYNLQMFTWVESFFGGYKTETEKLKAHIEVFAEGIKHLSWALNTIEDPAGFTEKTAIAIAVAIKIGSFLNILNSAGITNNLIHYTFFQRTFLGKRDQTAILVEHMKAFAQGIKDVSAAIGDITNPEGLEGNTAIAIAAATLISDFLKGITTDELIAGLGKYTIFEQIVLGKKDETKTLVDHMTTFGESVKTVSNSLKGVSTGTFIEDSASALAATRSILKFLVELTLAENDFSSGSTNFYKLTGAMGDFGRSLSAFEANTTGLDTVRMYSLSSSLSLLTTSISTLATMGSPEVIALLTGTFETIAEILSADFSADIATGIQNGTTDITTAITTLLDAAIVEINAYQSKFETSALYLMAGLSIGITKYSWMPIGKAKTVAQQVLDALNLGLEVNSPSEASFRSGVFLIDGLVNAVESEGDRAVRVAADIGASVAQALSDGMDAGFWEIPYTGLGNLTSSHFVDQWAEPLKEAVINTGPKRPWKEATDKLFPKILEESGYSVDELMSEIGKGWLKVYNGPNPDDNLTFFRENSGFFSEVSKIFYKQSEHIENMKAYIKLYSDALKSAEEQRYSVYGNWGRPGYSAVREDVWKKQEWDALSAHEQAWELYIERNKKKNEQYHNVWFANWLGDLYDNPIDNAILGEAEGAERSHKQIIEDLFSALQTDSGLTKNDINAWAKEGRLRTLKAEDEYEKGSGEVFYFPDIYPGEFVRSGKNIVKGLSDSITKNTPLATEAVTTMGGRIKNALDLSLEINSPSDATFRSGTYMVDGLVNSLETEGDRAVKAAEALGKATADALNKGGSSSGGGGSWLTDWRSTPEQIVANKKAELKRLAAESLLDEDKKAGSVAPKSTWDTIFEGLATVQEFLADPTTAFGPVIADLPATTGSTKPTTGLSTKAVVGRVNWSETVGKTLSQMRDLSILGDKLDRLGDAVLHMKIVMNSGVVVGQIKTEMDRALGTAALYAGRG